MPDWISRLAGRYRRRSYDPDELAASAQDVYLAPHSDDIAFSLGQFAKARGQGRLVTVFSRSHFTLRPGLAGLSVEEVTQMRLAEERRFADVCGLASTPFDLLEAPLRGQPPMDHARAEQELPALSPSSCRGFSRFGEPRARRTAHGCSRRWAWADISIM